MQDFFYEETSVHGNTKSENFKYQTLKIFSIISYTLAVLAVILFVYFPLGENILFSIILFVIIFGVFLASGIIFGKMKFRFTADYDYTFVTGQIRVSRVSHGVKRKHLITFDTTDIQKIGPYGSKIYERYFLSKDVKTMFLTSNTECSEGKKFYYTFISNSDGRLLLVFECTEIFIVNVLKFTSKTVIDEELK